MNQNSSNIFFLHGLESSGNGTKGRFLGKRFPHILRPDFTGVLQERLASLQEMCEDKNELIFIGSSYGGLMGSCFAKNSPEKVQRLILLAPALNFEGYEPPEQKLNIPALVVIGKHDDVTPIDPVLPLAEQTFSNLTTWISDDDHMLHNTFQHLDWEKLLAPATDFASIIPPDMIS